MRAASPNNDSCCPPTSVPVCCDVDSGVAQGWMISFAVISALVLTALMFVCLFNKCTSICWKRASTDTPRKKLNVLSHVRKVRPAEKMNLLQTVNYTVHANWDQLRVKFHDFVFFDKFCQALFSRYHTAVWKEFGREKRTEVICSTGSPVALRLLENVQLVILSKVGNYNWVMNDFQNICKNLPSSEWDADRVSAARLQPLTPRSATVGEERFDEGDYFVNICATELEIKFAFEWLYHNFMRVLTFENPEVKKSRPQGDCTLFKVGNEKSVSLYVWEEAQTMWISGDRRRDWYANDFHTILEAARAGFMPEKSEITCNFPEPDPEPVASTAEHDTLKPEASQHTAIYTVKTLDSGGYELEFPDPTFLISLKKRIQKVYPSIRWREYSARHVTKVTFDRDKTVSIHIADPTSNISCMWLYDPGCTDWFNGEFRHIYGATYEQHYNVDERERRKSPSIVGSDAVVQLKNEDRVETRI